MFLWVAHPGRIKTLRKGIRMHQSQSTHTLSQAAVKLTKHDHGHQAFNVVVSSSSKAGDRERGFRNHAAVSWVMSMQA